jgi:hemerythrin-like domain-containing protein
MAADLESGGTVDRKDVFDFGRFFRNFADKCHHGKEEDRLFVKLVEAGFPKDDGPIAVMLAEHEAGREEVRGLVQIGSGSGALSDSERRSVSEYAAQFVPLLYGHIQKENNILYPMAQNSIPPEEFANLDKACEAFDREVRGMIDIDALKELATDLQRRFPANPEDERKFGSCGSCH